MPRGHRSILSVAVLVLALAAGTAAGATPAAAAPTAAPTGPATHCVLAPGATAPACYADFPAAISAATGGRVKAPASATAAMSDATFTASLQATTLSSVVVGIEYVNANYGGNTLTLTAPSGCDNSLDADWVYNTLPSGWDNVISSFRSYNNCAQQLYRGTYRSGGTLTGIITNMSYVGSTANDQASSITAN